MNPELISSESYERAPIKPLVTLLRITMSPRVCLVIRSQNILSNELPISTHEVSIHVTSI